MSAVDRSAPSVSSTRFVDIATGASSVVVDRSAKSSRPFVVCGSGSGTPLRPNPTLLAATSRRPRGVAVQSITTQPLCVEVGAADSADETRRRRRRRRPFTAYATPLPKLKRPTRAPPTPVHQRNHPSDHHTPPLPLLPLAKTRKTRSTAPRDYVFLLFRWTRMNADRARAAAVHRSVHVRGRYGAKHIPRRPRDSSLDRRLCDRRRCSPHSLPTTVYTLRSQHRYRPLFSNRLRVVPCE